jgi:LysW-gamma-L-lysine carboxypeptidase
MDADGLKKSVAEIDGGVRVRFRGYEPAHSGRPDSALARAFTGAIRERGARPKIKYKTGTSDMNVVGPVWKCPIVAYGPGDGRLDHTPYECISIGEYERSIAVLASALGDLMARNLADGAENPTS